VLKRVNNSDTVEREIGGNCSFGLVRHGNKLTLSGHIKKIKNDLSKKNLKKMIVFICSITARVYLFTLYFLLK
jgi:hypothetical protein